jgi:hypothetical protein
MGVIPIVAVRGGGTGLCRLALGEALEALTIDSPSGE